jgi:hypothetical protein
MSYWRLTQIGKHMGNWTIDFEGHSRAGEGRAAVELASTQVCRLRPMVFQAQGLDVLEAMPGTARRQGGPMMETLARIDPPGVGLLNGAPFGLDHPRSLPRSCL